MVIVLSLRTLDYFGIGQNLQQCTFVCLLHSCGIQTRSPLHGREQSGETKLNRILKYNATISNTRQVSSRLDGLVDTLFPHNHG
jgi:hypothetical protein